MNQDKIEEIQRYNQGQRKNKKELNQEERKKLKALRGKMLRIAPQNRPELIYETYVVTNITQSSTVKTIHDASSLVAMMFQEIFKTHEALKIECKTDNDFLCQTLKTTTSIADKNDLSKYLVFLKICQTLR